MLSNEASAVQQALIEQGLETPLTKNHLSDAEKRTKITELMTQIIQTLELDLTDDSIEKTPERIAKMYVDEIFSGLNYENFPKITTVDNKLNVHQMIKIDNIDVTSTCEHHFITIDGLARVAYIPHQKILGLSKINRIVRFFAQRPQIQERLSQQIKIAIQTLTDSPDVAVEINAKHYCVKARGVMDAQSKTTTLALGGKFENDPQLRSEFMLKTMV